MSVKLHNVDPICGESTRFVVVQYVYLRLERQAAHPRQSPRRTRESRSPVEPGPVDPAARSGTNTAQLRDSRAFRPPLFRLTDRAVARYAAAWICSEPAAVATLGCRAGSHWASRH